MSEDGARPLDDDPEALRARIEARQFGRASARIKPGVIIRLDGAWCICTSTGPGEGAGLEVRGLPLDTAADAISSLLDTDDEDWRPPPRLLDAVLGYLDRRMDEARRSKRNEAARKRRGRGPRRRP